MRKANRQMKSTKNIDADYIRHNHELVDVFNRRVSNKISAQKFKTLAIYSALLILAIGFSILLVYWGLSLYKNPKVVEVPVITERILEFSPNIILPDTMSTQTEVRDTLGKISESISGSTGELGVQETRRYTVFNNAEFSASGFGKVVTGWQYDPEDISFPVSQYCYIEQGVTSAGSEKKFSLGKQYGLAPVNFTTSTDWKVIDPNVDISILIDAQRLCKFIRKN